MSKAKGDPVRTDAGTMVARYELVKEGTMWTDIREAVPRCRVRPVGETAVVAVIKHTGSEPEMHVLSGDVEIDKYKDEKYKSIRDEVAQ